METYLVTWNPKQPHSWKGFTDELVRVRRGERVTDSWSCGVHQHIRKGSRFYLIRLGAEPKGILAGGIINSTPYREIHWHLEKAKQGQTALYVDIVFDWLTDKPHIPLQTLNDSPFQPFNWTPQASGVRIPDPLLPQTKRSF